MEYQRALIPSKLGTGWFYAEGSCGDLSSYQSAFVFSLDGSTKQKIKAEGLRFFDDVQSRYFGGTWRETPFPNEGVLFNMVCAAQRSWAFPKDISAALKQPGSYFLSPTNNNPRNLIVLPDLGYVVFVASDR
ncbi:hypothetical protein [Tardiphaga robiniae]|uniref:Uncharacterized protein n=1 Tax=Tardiphaga robiniae TaxID=943830 RepID=A0A7G6TTE5_9BRAD|nr:hypothetical protein [Tardiphaga robiniae]QND70027.1 hypothetical protein HB776_01320 [Tardiphaga robiniae]